MARKPRIELAGKYHIINRGMAQMHIFKEPADYEYFEDLMCFYAKSFGITIHNYCLMGNHYHLLIEMTQPNLSKFMRQLNMNYTTSLFLVTHTFLEGTKWVPSKKLWVNEK